MTVDFQPEARTIGEGEGTQTFLHPWNPNLDQFSVITINVSAAVGTFNVPGSTTNGALPIVTFPPGQPPGSYYLVVEAVDVLTNKAYARFDVTVYPLGGPPP